MRCTGRKRRAAREALPTQRSSAARTASAASGSCMTCASIGTRVRGRGRNGRGLGWAVGFGFGLGFA
eukprot:scaffold518_cov55-Phaeocystis_antarctica.AAC.1